MIAGAARIALAAVLAFAAVAKLRRPGPDTTLVPYAIAAFVPYVELLVAGALLVFWSNPVPAIVAGVLVLAFTVVLVRAELARVPCNCFGGSSTRPAGAIDVLRNALLLAAAVLATGT